MEASHISFEHLPSATQQKILESAVKIFSQKGFSGSTTKEIAKEAGVSEATIFRYFETKKDLLFALISPAMVKSITDLFIDIHGKNDVEILKNFLRRNTEAVQENKDLLKIVLYEALFYPEIKQTMFQEVIQKKSKLLEKYFDQQREAGNLTDIEPRIATQALLGMLIGYVIWKHILKDHDIDQFNEEKVLDDMVQIFLHGIKKNRA
ncbi:TetR/AcrR family transcriptional regulator [Tepidibacillus infernus]